MPEIRRENLEPSEPPIWSQRVFPSFPLSYRVLLIILACLLAALLATFVAVAVSASSHTPLPETGSKIPLMEATDKPMHVSPYKVIDEECYLDRYHDFHMFCQVVPDSEYTGDVGIPSAPDEDGDGVVDVSEVKVDYVLYGYGIDEPFSSFSTWTDDTGYINVIVDFDALSNDIDDEHVIGNVGGLASYDIAAIADKPVEYSIKEHQGEPAWARDHWLYNDTWYHMDYRSYGTLESAARNSGHSPDPAVRERFAWNTAPQAVENEANANGSCNYWGSRNWIIVHDYSWIGQMWLTMCPGMTCWVDGKEYKVAGAFDILKSKTDWDVWDLVGEQSLILQTCDGAVYNRLLWVVPIDENPDPVKVAACEDQARNYTR